MAPRSSREFFEEDLYERDRYSNGGRRDRFVEEDIDFRRRSGPPVRELERLRMRDRSVPDFLHEDYTKSRDAGPLVLKRERDEFEYRPRERPRPREVDREEIRIIEEERDRERRRPVDRDEREEIRIRRRDRSLPPLEREREEYIIRRDRRSPPRSEYEQDEVIFRHSDRDRRRDYEWERDERYRSPSRHRSLSRRRSRSRHRPSDKEEIIIRRDEREGGRRRSDSEREEIIIRRQEERSPSPEPPAPIDPPPIRAPPIHQEVITHHRHIDHGFEVVPPPRVRSPGFRSPRDSFEEIKIHERGERNGRPYHDDITIDRRERDDSPPRLRRRSSAYYDRREEDEVVISRRRGKSLDREREIVIRERDRRNGLDRRDERDIQEEADYYNRINAERSYIGEAYNGATRDWTIVDVPPGTKRVTMDGIGGAKQEISWQRYNGVRRSRFITDSEEIEEQEPENDVGRIGRRYVGVKDRHEKLWTEITKDLVVREAIERSGYEFEETEYFYYIFAYLRYDDIAALVDLSEDIRRARRERIHEIHRERASLPPPPAPIPVRTPLMLERPPLPRHPWEEEKIRERDLVIEERRPARGRW
ncbi:hypothetical protein DTO021C3_2240 [Paecilomyces variotii]|nr:hypothetical protein DTO021C3_2240 [Paecilomyces variotii]